MNEETTDEIIVFTHNDLDAAGCMLNIEYAMPNVKKHYFHTNYSNIPDITREILTLKLQRNINKIIIPDVSFSDAKDDLRTLYNEFDDITHIDHHMYPEGFWDEFPNMKVVYDKSMCATMLCNKYFNNEGKCSNLDKLSTIIDVYDIWQDQHVAFDFSQYLNEYFWYCGGQQFVDKIIENGYKLPEDFTAVTQRIKEDIKNALESYEKRKLIQRAGDVSFYFVDEYFQHVNVNEMKNGANFVIGLHNWGLVQFRVNQHAGYSMEKLNKIRKDLTGKEEYGHAHCFTYKFMDNPKFDDIIGHASLISNVINSIKE